MNETYTSNQNVKVPSLLYGTAWKEERTADLVELALKSGFRGIDTACQPKHYQEDLVGEGLSRALDSGVGREDIYLQTKFTPLPGHDPARVPYDINSPLADRVKQSFEVSLKNLRVNCIDSLLLHGPLDTLEENLLAFDVLGDFIKSGQLKQLGISNCYSLSLFQALFESMKIKPSVLQNRFTMQTGYDVELREFCQKQGVLYQSFWTLTANPHVLNSTQVQKICKDRKLNPAQVFYRYLIQNGFVVLNGTTSPEHMKEDLAIYDFTLNEEECKKINEQGPFFLQD